MTQRIRTLDGIRGLAILLVLVGHVAANVQPLDADARRWIGAFGNSSAGVRLFFVLSGYLITTLLLREQNQTGGIAAGPFYRRRAWRIFPAFFTYLLVLTALDPLRPMGISFETFLAAGTFTWNYQALWVTAPPEGTWNLGHLWTLALEQQFYLVWPLVLAFASRRTALVVAIGVVIWCPLARVGLYYLIPTQRGMLGMMFHTAMDSIMAGCAVALLLGQDRVATWWRARAGGMAAAGAVWLFLCSPVVSQLVRGFPIAAGFTADALAAAAMVAWAGAAPSGFSARILGSGVLPKLGLISYSLYVWQQVFLSPSGWLGDGRVIEPLAGALLAAVASYYLVERPTLHRRPDFGPPVRTVRAQ